jgi:hypothetical protein
MNAETPSSSTTKWTKPYSFKGGSRKKLRISATPFEIVSPGEGNGGKEHLALGSEI